MRRVFSKEQVEFIQKNYNEYTYVEMSELELFKNISEKQIRNKARSLGIRKNRTFDDRFFENINTPEKAYFLGLLFADGWVTNSGEVGIELHYDDTYILQRLNKAIGNVHAIKKRKRKKIMNGYHIESHTSTLRIFSTNMRDDLQRHGVVPNKSKDTSFFPRVEGELFWHFLRGFMDGDGCVYKHTDQKYNMIHFTNASPCFLDHIQSEVSKRVDIHGKIYKETKTKYRLMYYRKGESDIILQHIYKNKSDLFLKRKHLKYLQ